MSRLPIRLRVTAALTLAMAAVLAGSSLFLDLRLSTHLATELDHGLQLRAEDLVARVERGRAPLALDRSARFVERGESYAELIAPDGRVVDRTRPLDARALLTPPQLRAALRAPVYGVRSQVPGLDEPSRFLATAVTQNGLPRILVVGATLGNTQETLSTFRRELMIAGPVALVVASVVGYLLAGLSLRQVERMRRRAAAISADTPGERLPVARTGDEVERLGTTLNEMLERLESALERERDFVADAGHELRTPLALLRTELELALRQARGEQELRDAVRVSKGEVERLCQLAEDLLLIASADRGRLPLRTEPVEVDDLFATVASRFAWRAEELDKSITAVPAAGVRIEGDRLRLEQALANLIDNALRHGGRDISLAAVRRGGQVELHVRDDGAGFAPDYLPRAFDRFTRAGTARSGGGAGLGLSIVQTIARAHGGSAAVAATNGAGADVWLDLPASGHTRTGS